MRRAVMGQELSMCRVGDCFGASESWNTRGGILESWNLGILESWSLGIGALTALALRNLGTHSLALTCVRDAARSCRCAVSDTHLTGWQRTARNAASSNDNSLILRLCPLPPSCLSGEEWFIPGAEWCIDCFGASESWNTRQELSMY